MEVEEAVLELLRFVVEFLRLVVEFLRLMCRGGCCGVADGIMLVQFLYCIGPSKDQFVYESSELRIYPGARIRHVCYQLAMYIRSYSKI